MVNHNTDQRLQLIRQEINAVDEELLHILNKRAALSLEVGQIKAEHTDTIFKPSRERQVLENLEAKNNGPLPNAHVRNIWREIFSSSRALQRPQRVAYLGPEGTFSYFAGVEYLGSSVKFTPYANFHDIFCAVHKGECELGIVPLENSLQGTVGQCFDLFYNFEVFIHAEVFYQVSHALLSKVTSLNQIKRVYSHSQPLTQCDNWLRINLPTAELVPVESTANAANRAMEDMESAAIGNIALANISNLNVLAKNIENSSDNWTRFVIIAKEDNSLPLPSASAHAQEHKKTSILFTLTDRPGSLAGVLACLAENSVNMRKLESRPLRLSSAESWRYVFFADVEADLEHVSYEKLVQELRALCNSFRILGSYPTVPAFSHVADDQGGVL